MDISQQIGGEISKAFKHLYAADLSPEAINIQPTRKDFEGTHTFVTFPHARTSRKSPEATGQELGDYLKKNSDIVRDFNVVKGFLNLSLTDRVWLQLLGNVLSDKKYGSSPASGARVMVEYSSPNTNKPLHLGHLRNNFLGFAVSNILEANGSEVLKVNLVNDRGIHICKSMLAYQKFGEGETPESANMKGDHLIGKYYVIFDQKYKKQIEKLVQAGKTAEEAEKDAPLIQEAQQMLQQWEAGDPEVVALWEKMNNWVYAGFDKTYQQMGVSFDKMYKESNTYLLGKDIVDEGLEKGVFYKEADNSVWVDLEKEKLDKKLVLRGDGTSVYMTQDMGTCDMKYKDFAFDRSVFVVGNEQDHHFKVLFSIMKKLGRSYSDGLYHLSYGMVDLPSGKMKSREGTVVDADDLMADMIKTARERTLEKGKIEDFTEAEAEKLYETIGLGALKYFLLKVDPKKRMLFNPLESIDFTGNTGPFLQYTHARASSILRRAESLDIKPEVPPGQVPLHESELAVLQTLSEFPEKVKLAAEEYSPSVIAQYTYDLAKSYNRFFQEVPIFNEEDNAKVGMRIALSKAVKEVICKALGLLGMDAPERM